MGIFHPGHNCWVVEPANRMFVVQDGERYYSLLRDALCSATHSVFILSWDIRAATNLLPKASPESEATAFDHVLRAAARRRPTVQFRILTWDYGALFTLERDPFTRWRLGWRSPRNVTLAFDDHHPVGACHHQKVVVIDDSLAFSGSMDITGHRWDTSQHRVREHARVDPAGDPYEPYHEVMAMIEGPAAAALGRLARERWRRLGARDLPAPAALHEGLWPKAMTPDFTNIDVAISRTMVDGHGGSSIRECEALYFDAIASARRTIYIENQYFTHPPLAEALARRLAEADGPEVVIVLPCTGDGWLDRHAISVMRDQAWQIMARADRHGRLRFLCPMASRERQVATFVHSKVLVIDDTLLLVGSANTNSRSMRLDTECDVAVSATSDDVARAVMCVRNRLVGEHLGMTEDAVGEAIRGGGSLRSLVDARATVDRTLVPIETTMAGEEIDPSVRALVDPDGPLTAGVAEFLPRVDILERRVPLRLWIWPGLALTGALLVAWHSVTPHGSWYLTLQHTVAGIRASPISEIVVLTGFLVGGLALVPLELAVVGTGFLLGAERGVATAVAGSVLMAALGYVAGRFIGPARIRRWVTSNAYRSVQQLGARGVTGMMTLRLSGIASAGAVHLLSGASRLRPVTYAAGTAIGLLPSVVALALLGALAGNTLLDPSVTRAFVTMASALGLLAGGLLFRTALLIRHFEPVVERERRRMAFG